MGSLPDLNLDERQAGHPFVGVSRRPLIAIDRGLETYENIDLSARGLRMPSESVITTVTVERLLLLLLRWDYPCWCSAVNSENAFGLVIQLS